MKKTLYLIPIGVLVTGLSVAGFAQTLVGNSALLPLKADIMQVGKHAENGDHGKEEQQKEEKHESDASKEHHASPQVVTEESPLQEIIPEETEQTMEDLDVTKEVTSCQKNEEKEEQLPEKKEH